MITKLLEKEINKSSSKISILVRELNSTNTIYKYNADKQFVSASTIKVFILLTALDEVKKGTIALDTFLEVPKKEILEGTKVFEHGPTKCSLEELLNWMIINSDNTATNVLIEQFSIDTIDKYIKETLDLKNTTLQRKMLDFDAIKNGKNNYISQNDMYITFDKIFNKTILTPKLCNKAIEILRNQRSKAMITRYIYQNVLFANKPGSLEGLINDSGVMCINKKLYYVGIFIHDYKTKEEALKLIGTLGKIIYNYLNQYSKEKENVRS